MSMFHDSLLASRSIVIAVPILIPTAIATADLVDRWEIGSGENTAMIQFDFLSGNTYVVDVSFDGSMSGQDAIQMIAADSTDAGFAFGYDVISYSFGDFLVGIDLDADSDYGDGSAPPYIDYWHYWTGETDGTWNESMVGFGDRLLVDGSADAWVFGTADAPAMIPAPATFAILLPALARRSRRRNG